MYLGERIMIIGSGGAGKSTLARQLGEMLSLPVIHLDAHFWQPGWVETPKEAWRSTVAALAAGEHWIIDGNYGGTIPTRLAAAQTIIFLDYLPLLCLYRVFKRRWRYRGRTRPDLREGCTERVQWSFVKWVLFDFPRRNRGRLVALLEECKAEKQVMVLHSPGETRRFVEMLSNEGFMLNRMD